MNQLLVDGVDIEPYLPLRLSDDGKERVAELARAISTRINERLPVVFRYNDSVRVTSPHNLYLQSRNMPDRNRKNLTTENYPWNTRLHTAGARKTIATDTYQVAQEGVRSSRGWRTFHLDKFDEQRLLGFDEASEIFVPEGKDPRSLENFLSTAFPLSPRFERSRAHAIRMYISQSSARALENSTTKKK